MVSYMDAMATTIQVSEALRDALKRRKASNNESYEEVIWDLLEDTMELSDETKKAIEEGLAAYERGEYYTHEQLKKELGIR